MSEKQKTHYAWWIMVSCCVIALTVLGFLQNGLGIFLAPVCKELGFSRGAITLYITIMQVVMIFSMPIAGRLYPKVNIKLLLPISIIGFACGYIIMSQGTSIIYWYIAGAVQGLFGGVITYLPIPILINNWFKAKTGFALGLASAFSGVGGMIINPLNQYFITNYGWRTGYIAMSIIACAIVVPFILFVVRFKPSDMGLLPYGAEEVKAGAPAAPAATGMSAAAALKTPSFWLMFVVCALLALTVNFNALIPGFITSIGQPAMVAATVASTVMFGVMLGKILLGVLNDKFGLKVASAFGLLGGTLSMILFLINGGNVILLYAGGFCYGLGFAMISVMPALLLKGIFGTKEFSAIYGNITIAQAIVGALSVAIFGFIFDLMKSFSLDLVIVGAAFILALLFVITALNLGKNLYEK